MRFVASKATSHPPIYRIFRTTARGSRILGWDQGMRSLNDGLVRALPAHALPSSTFDHLRSRVASEVAAVASELSDGNELAVTATLAEAASGGGVDVHVLAEPFAHALAPATPCVAALTAPQLPTSTNASDPWRAAGWATPGVHPTLSVSALPPGAEEAVLMHDGLLPRAPPTAVEGLNSNLAVLHANEAGEVGLTICSGGYMGATAQAVHARRQAALRRMSLGWFCPSAMRTTLAACSAQLRCADQQALEDGRWHAAWLLCKFRGARRLTALLLPDGTECALGGGETADRADQFIRDWVNAHWREDSTPIERIGVAGL